MNLHSGQEAFFLRGDGERWEGCERVWILKVYKKKTKKWYIHSVPID